MLVEAASLWVYIDGARGRPVPLDDDFHRRFGESAAGRTVSGRLRHRAAAGGPAPTPGRCGRATSTCSAT